MQRAGEPAPGKTVCRVPASAPAGVVDDPARFDPPSHNPQSVDRWAIRQLR
jgi:hypothetical protein